VSDCVRGGRGRGEKLIDRRKETEREGQRGSD
jgi:hypothetical protein